MKKILFCFCFMLALVFSNTLSVTACWPSLEPFEILSTDGNKVFVFIPNEDIFINASAAVYEIVNNERQIIYTVEGLSSSVFEWNLLFSADMMHFVQVGFPLDGDGSFAFEVFSNGVRTRTVKRSDFIKDHDGTREEPPATSIIYSPRHKVNWRIREHSPENALIAISTGEGNTFLFDLSIAEFIPENILFTRYEFSSTTFTTNEVIFFIILSSGTVVIGVWLFLLSKYKKAP